MDRVNIGIIGAGGIAQNAHLPGYQNSPLANVMAIADVNEEALEAARSRFDIPHTYTDYRELLSRDDIDAVSVCTPNYLHAEPTIAALKSGRHVLVEKPLAMDPEEGQRIVDAARAAGKQCMVGFTMRFGSDATALKRFIDAGELGNIYYGRAQFLRRRGIPSWGVFGEKEKQGGGALIDVGVHVLDLALWMMGHPKPVAISGVSTTKFGNREGVLGLMGQWDVSKFNVEDFGAGFIRFDNGAVLLLEASFCLNIQTSGQRQVSLMGDNGGADLDPLTIYREVHGSLVDITPAHLPKSRNFDHEMDAFVRAIAEGRPVPIPAEDGLVVTKIIDGLYRSAELGREVEIH